MKVKDLLEKLSQLDPDATLAKRSEVQDMQANRPIFSETIEIERVYETIYTEDHKIERLSYLTIKFTDFKPVDHNKNPFKS